ncbi:hypothetical protein PROFUN_05482 [Planoprotostelium fungivorum]|uniref:Uncharacterized protein n=1 Tax=Planoprotostelium fungivorum TaxID=1890364 RepID=A0A2P6NQV6_9EUKA|nr:hypothetical protein PROFUN_05482 [Planoprotostelium fungivorum]
MSFVCGNGRLPLKIHWVFDVMTLVGKQRFTPFLRKRSSSEKSCAMTTATPERKLIFQATRAEIKDQGSSQSERMRPMMDDTTIR